MPYASKGILRHNNYRSDPNLGPGIVTIRKIPCSCHACTTILSLSWDYKIKESVNQPRNGRVYDCKYYQILDCHNILILMNSKMMEQMKNITKTLIKLFLMVFDEHYFDRYGRKIWYN